MKHKKTKIRIGRVIAFLVAAILVAVICFTLIVKLFQGVDKLISSDEMYVASNSLTVPLYDLNYNEVSTLNRGTKVIISGDKVVNNEKEYYKINYDKNDYYILADALVEEEKDVVLEKEMYVRTSLTLYENLDDIKIK